MVDDVVLDLDKKKVPAAPQYMWMRFSKVLNKWVPCLESDHEAVVYKRTK